MGRLKNSAGRIQALPRYLFAEIDKKVREVQRAGGDIIKLGIGDPDLPTPNYIVKRMQEEVARAENHNYPPDRMAYWICRG